MPWLKWVPNVKLIWYLLVHNVWTRHCGPPCLPGADQPRKSQEPWGDIWTEKCWPGQPTRLVPTKMDSSSWLQRVGKHKLLRNMFQKMKQCVGFGGNQPIRKYQLNSNWGLHFLMSLLFSIWSFVFLIPFCKTASGPFSKFDPKRKFKTQNKIQNPKQKSARSETSYLAEQSTCAGAIQIFSRTRMGLFLQALHTEKRGFPTEESSLVNYVRIIYFLNWLFYFEESRSPLPHMKIISLWQQQLQPCEQQPCPISKLLLGKLF